MQRHIIRILWMPPIYAIECWLALRHKEQAIYLETARNCYEAYTVYCFYIFCVEFLGPPARLRLLLPQLGPRLPCFFPLCAIRWRAPEPFYFRISVCVLQYVPVRLTLALLSLIFYHFPFFEAAVFGPGFNNAAAWFAVILTASQAVAIIAMLTFVADLRWLLAPLRPVSKLVVVKFVVMISFWQGLLFAALTHYGVIAATELYSAADISQGLQNFLICIEMTVMAAACHVAFQPQDFARLGMDHLHEHPAALSESHAAADDRRPDATAGNGLFASAQAPALGPVAMRYYGPGLALQELLWPEDVAQDIAWLCRSLWLSLRWACRRRCLCYGASGTAAHPGDQPEHAPALRDVRRPGPLKQGATPRSADDSSGFVATAAPGVTAGAPVDCRGIISF
jgi:hypothetical protein